MFVMALLLLIWLGTPQAAFADDAPPALQVLQPSQSFGNIRQGDSVTLKYVVRNQTEAPLSLGRAEISQPGMRVALPGAVPPAGQVEIVLQWNTANVRGDVEAVVLVYSGRGDSKPLARLTASGTVTPRVTVGPLPAVFTSSFRGKVAERVLEIVNHDDKPLRITQLEPKGSHFVAALRTLRAGKKYQLKVTVPADTPPGRYRESVVLHTDNPKVPQINIPVNVLVKDDLYVTVENIDFGTVHREEFVAHPAKLPLLAQTILVKKREGRGDFAVTAVETDVPALRMTKMPEGRSAVFRIDVGLDVEKLASGPFAGEIRIRTDDPKFPELKLPVQGTVR